MRSFNSENLPLPRLSEEQKNHLIKFIEKSTAIDLEIGGGVGFHAVQYALNNPDRQLICIERTHEKYEKLYRRWINHNKPQNLLPIHADAVSLVHYFIPENIIRKVFFLYPNPESKNSAQRWINMPFFGRLLELLPNGCEILFATNELFYYEELLENSPHWPLKIVSKRSFIKADVEPIFRTHFEKKYLERGETCYEVLFKLCDDLK